MMGSEQRRLKGALVSKVESADQVEEVKLGLSEEEELLSPRLELAVSPASPSPSGSVLSYAES